MAAVNRGHFCLWYDVHMGFNDVRRAAIRIVFYGLTMLIAVSISIFIAGGTFNLLNEYAAPFAWVASSLFVLISWQELAPRLARKLGVE